MIYFLFGRLLSQCTYRCVAPPDLRNWSLRAAVYASQCTYRCVAPPDLVFFETKQFYFGRLNAPTGAWCSLTGPTEPPEPRPELSQCTYRCVVLPDQVRQTLGNCLPESQCTYRCVVLPDCARRSPTSERSASQCTYRCVVLPDDIRHCCQPRVYGLNAPTGAWCSLTRGKTTSLGSRDRSQCTYRCVVLPD